MRPPKRTSTTKLPRHLLDELSNLDADAVGLNPTTSTTRGSRNGRAQTSQKPAVGRRKERRRAEREEKRERRAGKAWKEAQARGKRGGEEQVLKRTTGLDIEGADDDSEFHGGVPRSKVPLRSSQPVPKSILKKGTKLDRAMAIMDGDAREIKPSLSRPGKKESQLDKAMLINGHAIEHKPSSMPINVMLDKLADDDAEISKLEKKLGIKRKKKLPKAFTDDGLDALLEPLGEDGLTSDGEGKKRRRTEEQVWLTSKRRKADGLAEEQLAQESEDDELLTSGSDGFFSGDDSKTGISDLESVETSEFEGFDYDNIPPPPPKPARENPYLPPTSTTTTPLKYIPPSIRASSQVENDSLARLRRQIQGLVNRLSEANLLSILSNVEQLYHHNARQHVTSTVVGVLLNLLCDNSTLSDKFLILHAGFLAAMYKIVGIDFGAFAVQRIVEEFDRAYKPAADVEQDSDLVEGGDGKKAINLMSLLAELYNLQVIGSNIIFDLLRLFLEKISEQNTELLLKFMRSSGPQLRQDDPSAAKDIVLLLQSAIAKAGESSLSVRSKFMVETINDLKNNRLKTGVGASTIRTEALVHMKKLLGQLNTRTLQATEPLCVGLHDIRNTEKKGKWWLVGASWQDEGEQRTRSAGTKDELVLENPLEAIDAGTTDLLQLAREQQMNTDVRRAIFVSIMSAGDYKDAHARLTKLRLKRAQEIEIPRVLIHCAGAEQVYNPYYGIIARRLCAEHRFKMAFQFCLWSLFKAMGETGDDEDAADEFNHDRDRDAMGVRKIVNLAKLFGTLTAEGALELRILKTLDFAYLQADTQTFVELLLITVLLHTQKASAGVRNEKTIAEVFSKISDSAPLARGLEYFLKKVVSKTDVAGGRAEKETIKWGCKVAGEVLAQGATFDLVDDV